ncbi:MAG: hypothetical protein AAF481_09370 [Acidobacteriota bacterium]
MHSGSLLLLALFVEVIAGTPCRGLDQTPMVTYPAAADFRVLALQSRVNWAIDGKGPSIHVYGDGRVHLHRPAVMKDSGDFEAWLTTGDLDALLRRLAESGLFEFSPEAARADLVEAMKRRRDAGESAPMITDAGTAVLIIQLGSYRAVGSTEPVQDFSKVIEWSGLDFDAETYPEVVALQLLDCAVSVIRLLGELVQDAAIRNETMIRLPASPVASRQLLTRGDEISCKAPKQLINCFERDCDRKNAV